ncbi:hypothetical protein APF79_00535 [bacterium BRH_c32]|nr:MAG: hypothetical protein APF79_00535 [bacterium BRH_c32]
MKKLFFITLLTFFSISSIIEAQDKGFGIGVMLGEPTGLSAKTWLNKINAVDFGLAYSFTGNHNAAALHADYLWHSFDLIKSTERIPVYYGVGARLRIYEGHDDSFGVRGVAGVEWFSREVPIDVFFEIAPVFTLIPETDLDFDAAIGIRFFIN